MKFDFKKAIEYANSFRNSKQAINMLLNKFAEKYPEKGKQLKMLYSQNKNPAEIIRQSAKNGEITLDELNKIKSTYSMARKLGLNIKVPESVWDEAETAIKVKNTDIEKDNFFGF